MVSDQKSKQSLPEVLQIHKKNKVRYFIIVLTYMHYSKGQQDSNITSIREFI